MIDEVSAPDARKGDYVEFFPVGTPVVGEYHCCGCGYGVTLRSALPLCPMCGGRSWEQAAWSPFSRARRPAKS